MLHKSRQDSENVRILHQKKVLLGSEGPGSTKAVYVAQAGLFYFFIGVPELRRRKYSSGKCDSVLKNL